MKRSPGAEAKSLKILKTWLTAVGIPHRPGGPGEADVVADDRSGTEVGVSLVGSSNPALVTIDGRALTGRSLRQAFAHFGDLQVRLGYEAVDPVDRGDAPEGKAHYADEPELVMIKHTELRRVPNPADAHLESYEETIDKATWRFLRSNAQLCADNMYNFDDLRQYAMMWTIAYIGLYEIENPEENENEKVLYTYLSQRFTAELRGTLLKKQRSILPMLDEAFIGTRGRTYDYSNKAAWEGEEIVPEEVDDPQYVSRHCKIDTASSSSRKSSAARLLVEQLSSLPHDSMVDVLAQATTNDRIDMDARKEAARRLKEHVVKCQKCQHLQLPELASGCGIETPSNVGIEDENGVVYESAAAAAKVLGLVASNIRSVLAGKYRHSGGHTFKYVLPTEVHEQATGTDPPGRPEEFQDLVEAQVA